jgi:hypothetical protein
MECDSNLFLKMFDDPRLENIKKEILDETYSHISNETLEEVGKNKDKASGLHLCP